MADFVRSFQRAGWVAPAPADAKNVPHMECATNLSNESVANQTRLVQRGCENRTIANPLERKSVVVTDRQADRRLD